jgi:hypothetical protein
MLPLADLFSETITLFNWAVQQRLEGRIVASMDEKEENASIRASPDSDETRKTGQTLPDFQPRTECGYAFPVGLLGFTSNRLANLLGTVSILRHFTIDIHYT